MILTFSDSDIFRFRRILTFSNSDVFQFWKILTFSDSDIFWFQRILTFSDSDKLRLWRFQILTFQDLTKKGFWHFPTLTCSALPQKHMFWQAGLLWGPQILMLPWWSIKELWMNCLGIDSSASEWLLTNRFCHFKSWMCVKESLFTGVKRDRTSIFSNE